MFILLHINNIRNMIFMNEMYQTADWKNEKHVPVLEVSENLKKGENIQVSATIGKAIKHPNTTAHHIRWISLYFLPEGEKFPYEIGKMSFSSHGESVDSSDSSTVYSEPQCVFTINTEDRFSFKHATKYCL